MIHPSRAQNVRAGLRDMEQQEKRRDRYGDEAFPVRDSVYKGKVVRIKEFGAFSSLEGFKRQGLIHISEISEYRVQDVASVLEEGQQVYVKVLDVDEDEGKIGLSMKHVNQRTGEDEDANNVKRSRAGGKRGRGDFEQPAERTGGEADAAMLSAVCKRCGGSGHLALECFALAGQSFGLVEATPQERERERQYDELMRALEAAKRRKAERKAERAAKRAKKKKKKKNKKKNKK